MRLFFLFLFISFNLYSQNLPKNISSSLKSYFANNKTTLYCHLNKTKFLPGEEIWYSVYAFNKANSKIISEDFNANISLHQINDLEVDKNLILVKKGKTYGNILLQEKIKPGFYYIKVTSTEINNLNTNEAFYKKIEILGKNSYSKNTTSKKYNIQILPEGGHLVENLKSKCGFKIINQSGVGVKVKNLKLIDNENRVLINTISSNNLGMGSFVFTPKEGQSYYLVHENIIKSKIPFAKKNGIVLGLKQNFKNGHIKISLTTNKKHGSDIKGERIVIALQKNSFSKFYTTSFKKNISEITIDIPNKEMYLGVNTITVFYKNKPILERLFFNSKTITNNTSYINFIDKKNDTTTLGILNKVNKKSISSNISISVLSTENLANKNRTNIYSSVFLTPFIRGTIENPSYYFSNITNKKKYNLDILLLNQGWRKYSWNDIFKKKENKTDIDYAKNGISIKGYVKTINKKDDLISKVLIHSKNNQEFSITNVDKDLKFQFHNLELRSNTEINFSALSSNGKPIKSNIFFVVEPNSYYFKNKHKNPFINSSFSNFENTPSFFTKESTILEEVNIKANKLKFEEYTHGRYGIKIDSSHYGYTTIESFFVLKEKLKLRYIKGSMFTPPGYYWTYRNGQIARFLINGKKATYMNGLLSYPMQNVLEIYFGGKDGFGRRMSHLIFTNGKELEIPKHLRTSKKFKLVNSGFNIQKEYYQPLFQDFSDDFFLKFGAIYWIPELITSNKKVTEFKITHPKKEKLIFYIEGFTESGLPFSTIAKIK